MKHLGIKGWKKIKNKGKKEKKGVSGWQPLENVVMCNYTQVLVYF